MVLLAICTWSTESQKPTKSFEFVDGSELEVPFMPNTFIQRFGEVSDYFEGVPKNRP